MTRDTFPPATLSVAQKNKSGDFVDNRRYDSRCRRHYSWKIINSMTNESIERREMRNSNQIAMYGSCLPGSLFIDNRASLGHLIIEDFSNNTCMCDIFYEALSLYVIYPKKCYQPRLFK